MVSVIVCNTATLFSSAIEFHMPPICSPIVRPGRPAEVAPVVSKQLSDTLLRLVEVYFLIFCCSKYMFAWLNSESLENIFLLLKFYTYYCKIAKSNLN